MNVATVQCKPRGHKYSIASAFGLFPLWGPKGIVKLIQTPVTVRQLGHEKYRNIYGLSLHCSQIRKKRGQLGDIWYLDEVFVKINGDLHYLWRAGNAVEDRHR
jgi:hypothetical protein